MCEVRGTSQGQILANFLFFEISTIIDVIRLSLLFLTFSSVSYAGFCHGSAVQFVTWNVT